MYLPKFAAKIMCRAYSVLSVRMREHKWATTYLSKLEEHFGGQLRPATRKKIITCYSIYIPMICDIFASLRGRKTSAAEKERMLLYFICSSIFDDFCDLRELTHEQLYNISYAPDAYPAQRLEEHLFIHAHMALEDFVQDKASYKEVTMQLFKAQVESDQQFDPSISNEVLQRITQEKGGYAVLLCHFYMDATSCEAEKDCWYRMGGIIQLTNDLYDIYKDLQDGSETLPNRIRNVHAFQGYFSELVQGIKNEVSHLPFSAARKRDFLLGMMAICSFGQLALHRLMRLQGEAELLPDLRTLPRKALIVDMENLGSIFFCIRYTYRQMLTGSSVLHSAGSFAKA